MKREKRKENMLKFPQKVEQKRVILSYEKKSSGITFRRRRRIFFFFFNGKEDVERSGRIARILNVKETHILSYF